MNKTRIEWCDYTWNPITGCLHPCSYCYARKIARRFAGTKAFPNGFAPTWHPERLTEPDMVRKRSRVFAVSMGDPFGATVQPEWLAGMFGVMERVSRHQFLLLTKAPYRIVGHLDAIGQSPLANVWLGCSITGGPGDISQPTSDMTLLRERGWHVFVSLEPLLGLVQPQAYDWAEWIIVGSQTQPDRPVSSEAMEPLLANRKVPRFFKDTVRRRWWGVLPQEYPPELADLSEALIGQC